ncbi:hypothetical protein KUTeg_012611 [Tegillarca granosa]|uniref:Uncharacterized protein n=1 Tax=Tegillarca granosa TaxID=220873 RepID=A0ABQ9F024_TEGGR|nr:hypothetical protein KUTeg_012611 [Tegillarca granosa]
MEDYLRTTGHLPETPCLEKFKKYNPYSALATPLSPELTNIIENYARKTRKTSKCFKSYDYCKRSAIVGNNT